MTRNSDAVDGSSQGRHLEELGLATRPFGLTPDPAFFFESKSHGEAVARLASFLSRKEALALIVGDVGTGKTVVSRHFLASLDRNLFNTGLIVNPVMNETEFLSEVIRGLGYRSEAVSRDLAGSLRRHLLRDLQKGRQTVLAIDEAQLLSDQVLQFLGGLASVEAGEPAGLQVVLFGQEEMVARFLRRGMKEVRRVVTLTHCLRPLSEDEVARYVVHRLSVAGSNGTITVKDDATRALFAHSRGYPRIINTLCDQCLLLLSSRSAVLNGKIVKQAIKRMGGDHPPKGTRR
jgi:general secretion pathway protein A